MSGVFRSKSRQDEQGLLWRLGLIDYYRCHEYDWREGILKISRDKVMKILFGVGMWGQL